MTMIAKTMRTTPFRASPKPVRAATRPMAGDEQDYPLWGKGTWTPWSRLGIGAQAQARAIDRALAGPGCLCLVAQQGGRVLRVISS